MPTREWMLERMLASDRACNGRFLTGVLTTGIYCLPSCPARKPKPENVRFFDNQADAQAFGLRACRRCRPDDYYRQHDPDLASLKTLLARLQTEPESVADVTAMAASLGMGASKLHGLLRQHYHATPNAVLTQARIDRACQLLQDPGVRTIETAFAVGFESVSAFHEQFRRTTAMQPGAYQQLGQTAQFTLSLPDGYRSEYALDSLKRDTNSRMERVTGNRISKTLHTGQQPGLLHLTLTPTAACAHLETPATPTPDEMRYAHRMALRLLGLPHDPTAFERKVESDEALRPLLGDRHGLRLPLTGDIWEAVVWSILGQQISLPFAFVLRQRLADLCGTPIGEDWRVHPTPMQVASLDYADLTPLQYSRSKAAYLIDTARRIVSGELALEPDGLLSAAEREKQLLAVRGLGPWAVNYILMRGYGYADCAPIGDSGLRAALKRFFILDTPPDSKQVAELMERFAPHRSLATFHLWRTLEQTP